MTLKTELASNWRCDRLNLGSRARKRASRGQRWIPWESVAIRKNIFFEHREEKAKSPIRQRDCHAYRLSNPLF